MQRNSQNPENTVNLDELPFPHWIEKKNMERVRKFLNNFVVISHRDPGAKLLLNSKLDSVRPLRKPLVSNTRRSITCILGSVVSQYEGTFICD